MQWLEIGAWLLLALWIWKLWPVWYGLLFPRRIQDVLPVRADDPDLPLVSIIVPARDEAEHIEESLHRLLALDYPNFEIIAIDDRSTDATGGIIQRMAGRDPRCRPVRIEELPPGWLGKNHANWIGAGQARGELLLFTDADVRLHPQILGHAVAAIRHLGHLVLFPDAMMRRLGETLLMNYFAFQFALITQASLVRFRWARKAFVGVGAFNLLRRSAYERIGGHERLRMEVADDLMLGKLVKDAGLRQDCLDGSSHVQVPWQRGMSGIIRGLEKNAFAGARYSLSLLSVAAMAHLLLALAPIAAVAPVPARLPLGLLGGLTLLTLVGCSIRWRHGLLAGPLYPIAALVFVYILIRSTYVTLRDDGVTWRGTFYPLAELRAGMIEWRPLGGSLRGRPRTV